MKRALLTLLVTAPFLLVGAWFGAGERAGAEDSPQSNEAQTQARKLVKAMKAERNSWEKERAEKAKRIRELEARQAELEKELAGTTQTLQASQKEADSLRADRDHLQVKLAKAHEESQAASRTELAMRDRLETTLAALRKDYDGLYADREHYRNQKIRVQLFEHENYQGEVIVMDLYARSDKGSEEVYALPNLGKCKCPHSGIDVANWNDIITSVRVQRIQEK